MILWAKKPQRNLSDLISAKGKTIYKIIYFLMKTKNLQEKLIFNLLQTLKKMKKHRQKFDGIY